MSLTFWHNNFIADFQIGSDPIFSIEKEKLIYVGNHYRYISSLVVAWFVDKHGG